MDLISSRPKDNYLLPFFLLFFMGENMLYNKIVIAIRLYKIEVSGPKVNPFEKKS